MIGDFRIEQWADGWAVIEEVEEPCEYNNYGVLAAGCPDEDDARAWLARYREEELQRECEWWEWHAYESDAAGPPPF